MEGAVRSVVPAVIAFLPQHVAGGELCKEGDDEDGDVAAEFVGDDGYSHGLPELLVVVWVELETRCCYVGVGGKTSVLASWLGVRSGHIVFFSLLI